MLVFVVVELESPFESGGVFVVVVVLDEVAGGVEGAGGVTIVVLDGAGVVESLMTVVDGA